MHIFHLSMQRILLLSALILSFPTLIAEEPAVVLPDRAQKALDQMQEDLAEAQADYDEAVQKAYGDALKDLDREIKRATKSGDLQVALVLQEKSQEIAAKVMTGEDPDTSRYAQIQTSMTALDLKTGSLVCDNRSYQWTEVPDLGQSMQYTQQTCRAPKTVSFQVINEGVVLCASDVHPGAGWEPVGTHIGFPGFTANIYKQAFKQGNHSLSVSSSNYGIFLIIPSRSK